MAKKDSQNIDGKEENKIEEIKESIHRIIDIDISKEIRSRAISIML